MTPSAHDALALLLEYPGPRNVDRMEDLVGEVAAACPPAEVDLRTFLDAVQGLPRGGWEELYTRTFDINPACTLEVGWQVYGEQYARGALLARLRGLLRKYGVAETTELPDHLTQVIRLTGRMAPADAAALVRGGAAAAVAKMRESLDGKGNPYGALMSATARFLQERAALVPEGVAHE